MLVKGQRYRYAVKKEAQAQSDKEVCPCVRQGRDIGDCFRGLCVFPDYGDVLEGALGQGSRLVSNAVSETFIMGGFP